MAPKAEDKLAVLLEGDEGWAKIKGEEAEMGFLLVLEVFSKWCGPSEAIISTVKRISMDFTGRRLKFYQLEARADVEELAKYAASSRPAFLLFKDGELLEVVEGVNAPLLEKFIGDLCPEGVMEMDEDAGAAEDDD